MTPDEPAAPVTGPVGPSQPELTPEEEPVVTGTLFLTMLILTVIGAVWIVMYSLLLHR
jgi:hypothetical protein